MSNNEHLYLEAHYILDNHATVRQTGDHFGRSKSAVHIDMKVRLPHFNKALASEVAKVLNVNLAERNIRGGLATKAKYEKMRKH